MACVRCARCVARGPTQNRISSSFSALERCVMCQTETRLGSEKREKEIFTVKRKLWNEKFFRVVFLLQKFLQFCVDVDD